MRRIFVGDIQGCLKQLEELLVAVDFEAGVDRLVPVGDMVNKGPDSDGVLDLCMQVQAEPVLGNHDLHWLAKDRCDARHQPWLAAQPIVRIFDDLIAVHAGLHPTWDEAKLGALTEEEGGGRVFSVALHICAHTRYHPPLTREGRGA